ncbi:hypothetical protein Sjap_020303 [Stephania japonica]|uniref:MSP domain-containing protein n=1 Tax=Stephania japonica TaxID=461633 RepID=A0AAP0I0K4_9MAGN
MTKMPSHNIFVDAINTLLFNQPHPTKPNRTFPETQIASIDRRIRHFRAPIERQVTIFLDFRAIHLELGALVEELVLCTGEMLRIEPQELKFPFELKKQISCSLQLSNNTDNYVAFKVKTTNPKKYCVRPNTGIILPRSTSDVIVTMQAQREAPPEMQCKDKFLLQSVVASPGATTKDITPEMFNKESGNLVEECKLKVVYVSPPQPPSPVQEGSEEGSSPRASISENGNSNTSDFGPVSRAHYDTQEKSSEAKAVISKLSEEKNSAMQQANKLRQELELLKRESYKSRAGISFLYVVLVGLFGVLLGYLLKRT